MREGAVEMLRHRTSARLGESGKEKWPFHTIQRVGTPLHTGGHPWWVPIVRLLRPPFPPKGRLHYPAPNTAHLPSSRSDC